MMEDRRYTTFEGLLYLSLPTGGILLALAFAFEPQCHPVQHMKLYPWTHFWCYSMALFTNLTGYYAQKYTSALTFKVNSYLKNFLFILFSLFIYEQQVTVV